MRFLALIGALAIIVGIGAAVFFLGGFYSVAGTAEDPGIVRWALIQVRTASINRHATDQPPANINDAQTVQAGAKAFAAHGCANCHGAPGVPWQKYSEGLHPDPPDLKKVVDHQTPAQLFWVVKNGINMTGMPSFQLAGAKDEEIWAIAAFLKRNCPPCPKPTTRPGPHRRQHHRLLHLRLPSPRRTRRPTTNSGENSLQSGA